MTRKATTATHPSVQQSVALCDEILDVVFAQLCDALSDSPSIDNQHDYALMHATLCAFCNWEVLFAEIGD